MACDDVNDHEGLTSFCPTYQRALEVLGRRWTGAILRFLLKGPARFNEIAQTIPGLSDRLLSERLKELEAEGLVVRTVAPETPVRIEYELTPKGASLESVIQAISAWAATWATDNPHKSKARPQTTRRTSRTGGGQ